MANISAAPNETWLAGQVTQLERLDNGKVNISIKIASVDCIYGPCFAEIGQEVRCFTFIEIATLAIGQSIRVKAEYIGGPFKGKYQILSIERRTGS